MRYATDKRYMGARNLLKPGNRSYFGLDFAYHVIPNELVPYDYATLAAWPGLAEAVVTDVETGRPAYFPVTGEDDHFVLLQATCAMPLLFPIYDYHGMRCLDGGASDGIPWKRALEQGCDRVVVVLTPGAGLPPHSGKDPARHPPGVQKISGLCGDHEPPP